MILFLRVIDQTYAFLGPIVCGAHISNFSQLPLQNEVAEQISLDPLTNKTGNVWHVFLKGDFKDMLYGYKFDGKFSPDEGLYYDSSRILLDPYAKVSVLHELFTLLYLLCFFFTPNTFNIYLLTILSMNKIFHSFDC